jgi:hypoxanthine phosphoribosyltransferase
LVASGDLQVLIDADRIQQRVGQLAKSISIDYKGLDLHLVGVLKGAFQFTRDLSRALTVPHSVDYISVASYGMTTHSSGNVELRHELSQSIRGRNVVIVDDIIDTGNTLIWLIEHLKTKHPDSVRTCCFLDKPSRRTVELKTDYLGYPIEDLFVVGYGLDYQEKYRELPYISWVSPREVTV